MPSPDLIDAAAKKHAGSCEGIALHYAGQVDDLRAQLATAEARVKELEDDLWRETGLHEFWLEQAQILSAYAEGLEAVVEAELAKAKAPDPLVKQAVHVCRLPEVRLKNSLAQKVCDEFDARQKETGK